MRNRYGPIIFLCLIHLFFLVQLTKPGIPKTHDGDVQIARIGAYYKAFGDRHIPPRWAADLNFGYGTPALNFYYPLPGYLGSLFHALGVSLQDSFKLLAGGSIFFSSVSFYLWMKRRYTTLLALTSSLFYGLAPYHFLDLYVRGDLGELLAFVLIPLIFLFLDRLVEKPTLLITLGGSLLFGLFILSHHGIALIFGPVFLLYALYTAPKLKRTFFYIISLFLLGLLFSAYFWIPAFYDSQYLNQSLFSKTYLQNFPSFEQLIFSSWGFGSDVMKPGGLSPQNGVLQFIVGGLSIFLLFRSKKRKNEIVFWVLVVAISTFFELKVSMVLWDKLPLLKNLQFPWRFTALSSFAIAVLSGHVLSHFKDKRIMLPFLIALIGFSIPFTKTNDFINRTDQYYLSYAGSTSFHGETSTIWTAGDPSSYAKYPIEIISGDGKIYGERRKTILHTFAAEMKKPGTIVDNTTYFPGWNVAIDNNPVPIQFQDPNHKGLIVFPIPQGKHTVAISFHETSVRMFANFLSVATLSFLALSLIVKGVQKK